MKLIDIDKEHFKLKVLVCPVSKKSCMLLESKIRHKGFEMASKKETVQEKTDIQATIKF